MLINWLINHKVGSKFSLGGTNDPHVISYPHKTIFHAPCGSIKGGTEAKQFDDLNDRLIEVLTTMNIGL